MANFAFPALPWVDGVTEINALGYNWTWHERDGHGYWLKNETPGSNTGIPDSHIFFSKAGARAGSPYFRHDHSINQTILTSTPAQTELLLDIRGLDASVQSGIKASGLYQNEFKDGSWYARKDGKWAKFTPGLNNRNFIQLSSPVAPSDGDIWWETNFSRLASGDNDKRAVKLRYQGQWQSLFRFHVDSPSANAVTHGSPAEGSGYNKGDVVFLENTSTGLREPFYVGSTLVAPYVDKAFFRMAGTDVLSASVLRVPTTEAECTITPAFTGDPSLKRTLSLKKQVEQKAFASILQTHRWARTGPEVVAWSVSDDFIFGRDLSSVKTAIKRSPRALNGAATIYESGTRFGSFHAILSYDLEYPDQLPWIADQTANAFQTEIDVAPGRDNGVRPQCALLASFYSSAGGDPTPNIAESAMQMIRFVRDTSTGGSVKDSSLDYFKIDRDGRISIANGASFGASRLHTFLHYRHTPAGPDKYCLLDFDIANANFDPLSHFVSAKVNGVEKWSVDMDGTIRTGQFEGLCDVSLKSNIGYQSASSKTQSSPFSSGYYGMDKLKLIQTANYNFKGKANTDVKLGLLADDVVKHMRDITGVTASGVKTIDMMGIVSVLVNAVKELNNRITVLENLHNV